LSQQEKNPSFLKKPYYILHLDLLQRLVSGHPEIKSLTLAEFVERSFKLAYEFVYNEKAPAKPTDEIKRTTLHSLHTRLELMITQRITELGACKNSYRK
jgi:hypothetical protein